MQALHFKPTLGLLFIGTALLLPAIAQPQKLPNVQKAAVYAAGPVKIDGKAVELNHKFQAYNKATDCFYTLSNDDTNLYLTVQIRISQVVVKAIGGGITLRISPGKEKNDSSAIQLTFPALSGNHADLTNRFYGKGKVLRESKEKDIDVTDLNRALSLITKTMKVQGFDSGTEESRSVYNEEGIKVAAAFDPQLYYTYELQLPLKHVKALRNGAKSFKYNLRVNPPESKPYEPGGPPPPPVEPIAASTTDFWGEYTLAKKP